MLNAVLDMYAQKYIVFFLFERVDKVVGLGLDRIGPFQILLQFNILLQDWKVAGRTYKFCQIIKKQLKSNQNKK